MENDISFLENYIKKIIYTSKDNISLLNISKQRKIPISNIVCENNLVRKGEYVLISNKQYKTYIVKPADTISSIAMKFNIDEDYLKNINKISKIFIGQQLII